MFFEREVIDNKEGEYVSHDHHGTFGTFSAISAFHDHDEGQAYFNAVTSSRPRRHSHLTLQYYNIEL